MPNSGTFSRVFLGYVARTGESVAIKAMPTFKYNSYTVATFGSNYREEVNALHAVKGHKNVVHFYGTFKNGDDTHIVMERANKETLSDYLHERKEKDEPLSEAEVKDLARQIIDGIKVTISTIIFNTFSPMMLACALKEYRASG